MKKGKKIDVKMLEIIKTMKNNDLIGFVYDLNKKMITLSFSTELSTELYVRWIACSCGLKEMVLPEEVAKSAKK